MKILMDTSVFIRLFDNDNEINDFVSKIFDAAQLKSSIKINLPPILYSEIVTNSFYYLKDSEALRFIKLIDSIAVRILKFNKKIFEECYNIAKGYHATGGADTLIVSWTKYLKSVLLTADDTQYKKAKHINISCFNITNEFERSHFNIQLIKSLS